MNSHISNLRKHVDILEAFGRKYTLDIPDDLTSINIDGSVPTINIFPEYAPNEAGKEKVLAMVGVAFGSHDWTAKPSYGENSYDWIKELDGVRLRVHEAETMPKLQERPVAPNAFPVLLEDAARSDDTSDPYGLDREAARNEAERSEPFI